MQRREFITLLCGVAVAWPRAARAQKADRVRRVGVIENRAADDPEGEVRLAVFLQGLQELGWTESRKYADRSTVMLRPFPASIALTQRN